jgi:hypothetical protein
VNCAAVRRQEKLHIRLSNRSCTVKGKKGMGATIGLVLVILSAAVFHASRKEYSSIRYLALALYGEGFLIKSSNLIK